MIILICILFGITYEKILIEGIFKNLEGLVVNTLGSKKAGLKRHNFVTKLLTCPYCLSGQLALWLSVFITFDLIMILFNTLVVILAVKIILDLWKK